MIIQATGDGMIFFKEIKKSKKLMILTIMILIFPIVPLAIMATVVIVSFVLNLEQDIVIVGMWFLGGPLGAIGLLNALFNNRTGKVLVMQIYGFISYSIITIPLVIGINAESLTLISALAGIYFLISLVVFALQINKTYRVILLTQRGQK
jgi:hypothetical protein